MAEENNETDGDVLARLGTDGDAWAREFFRLDPLDIIGSASPSEDDVDLMRGWFRERDRGRA